MEKTQWTYFQFRKAFDYPVYVRFQQSQLNPKYSHVLQELGFSVLSESELKKIPLQKIYTKILTVQEASPKIEQQIGGSDLLDKYGSEVLSLQSGTPVYTYRKVGMMTMPSTRALWDLALHSAITHTDQMVGLRVILVRYLAQALADHGILSYWGTVKDKALIIMKQSTSYGEAIFIDPKNRIAFSNGGEVKIGSSLTIIRKDKEGPHSGTMSREDLIGFMTVSTCLLSFNGITHAMKRSIYELSAVIKGSFAAREVSPNL